MYVYGCLLLPAIKQITLKELPTCLSWALLHGYSYIFSPSITDRKPQHRLELPGDRSGSRSQQPGGGQNIF